jgi:uncharacterized protein YkwD
MMTTDTFAPERRRASNPAARCAALAVAFLAASCGGGGGDSASDTVTASASAPAPAGAPAAAPAPAPTPVAAPSPAAPTTTGSTCGISDFAAASLARMNALRAAGANCRTGGNFGPAPALTWNALLTQSAQSHSQDMVAHNYFSHTGSDGSTLSTRVDATGYLWLSLGENIAAGFPTLDAVMTGWMASDDHCANLMNPALQEVGLVCVPGTASTTYSTYWTMDLGQPP